MKKIVMILSLLLATSLLGNVFLHDMSTDYKKISDVRKQEVETLKASAEVKIQNLKDKVVEELASKCESTGFTNDDAPMILDSNKEISIGRWMYQRDTVIHYYQKLYEKKITRREAVIIALDEEKASQLTQDILFKEVGGHKNWYNCSKKLNIADRVSYIKELES